MWWLQRLALDITFTFLFPALTAGILWMGSDFRATENAMFLRGMGQIHEILAVADFWFSVFLAGVLGVLRG